MAKCPRTSFLIVFKNLGTESGLIFLGTREACESAASIRSRRSSTRVDTVEKGVEGAEALISMGEISAARHALEGSPVAPGNEDTLNALREG